MFCFLIILYQNIFNWSVITTCKTSKIVQLASLKTLVLQIYNSFRDFFSVDLVLFSITQYSHPVKCVQYHGAISWVLWGRVSLVPWGAFCYLNTSIVLDFSPWYWLPPRYSWYPPTCIMMSSTVLKISSYGTHDIPHGTEHTLYKVIHNSLSRYGCRAMLC